MGGVAVAVRVQREWPRARLDLLLALREQGKSASVIASEIGVSRGAVLGAVKRARDAGAEEFNWSARPVHVAAHAPSRDGGWRRKLRPDYSEPTPACPPLPLFKASWGVPDARDVPLVDLGVDECRWFDDAPDRCCGAPTRKGQSYCQAHSAIVYRRAASSCVETSCRAGGSRC